MKFFCLHCGQKIGVQTMHAGRSIRCPKCGQELLIPKEDAAAPESAEPIGLRPITDAEAAHPPDPNLTLGFRGTEESKGKPDSSEVGRGVPVYPEQGRRVEPAATGEQQELGLRAVSDSSEVGRGVHAEPVPPGDQQEPQLRAIPDSVPPSPDLRRTGPPSQSPISHPESPIPNPPPAEGLGAISELKQTLQSNIDRSHRTISQFMQEKQLEGAIDLNATDDPSSASKILTADQGRKYQLGDVVAKGGMGAIIDAKDANLRRSVAMKVVIDPKSASKETILRFIQEAQVTSQLEHPSIVPVHELGVDASGNVFYTMKFVRGITLKDILKKVKDGEADAIRDYPLARLLNIFQKVCDAIAFAHSKRVIHRDLKPENIMIGDFGEVLVMDWGLSKVLPKKAVQPKKRFIIKGKAPPRKAPEPEPATPSINSLRRDLEHADALKTLDGAIMGTPGFMAPEQAMGKLDEMDLCTDIYALGAILYNILTLRPPVQGRDLGEVLQKVSTGDIPPPTSFNPKSSKTGSGDKKVGRTVPGEPSSQGHGSAGTPRPTEEKMAPSLPHLPGNLVPDSLSAVTMKALSLEPSDRYPTVQALQREIEAFQGGFATSAEHAGAWRQVQLFLRRHKTVAILSLVALFGIMGGAVVSTLQWISAAKARNVAVEKANEAREALTALTGTAPALMAQARTYIEQGDASNAAKQATYAAELMPNSPEYLVFKGDMLECALKIKGAAEAYEKALELLPQVERTVPVYPEQGRRAESSSVGRTVPGEPSSTDRDSARSVALPNLRLHAQQNLALCRKILAENKKYLTPAAVTELHIAMRNQDRFAESFAVMRHIGKDTKTLDTMFKAILDKRGVKYRSLTVENNGKCSLDLSGSGISDLRLLQGLPLMSLSLAGCPVTDLSPLKGMPLTTLNLEKCPVTNLSPLKGMPLTTLALQCPVTDLSPLNGMPLMGLSLFNCDKVTDLSPLKGIRLTSLNLKGCGNVTDLSPLKGMPLTSLHFHACPVTDLLPLKGMPLTSLDLRCPVTDLSPLKGMKTLTGTGIDPWPLLNKPLMQAIAAKNTQQAETEAKKLVADWSDVPAMAVVVQKVKSEYLELVIPLMKNPDQFPASTKTFNGHHYYLWSQPMSWADAKKFCESVGGHLVTITSKEEHAFVMQLTESDKSGGCHIGLTRDNTTIKWITGEPWDETVLGKLAKNVGSCGLIQTAPNKCGDMWVDKEWNHPSIIEWDR